MVDKITKFMPIKTNMQKNKNLNEIKKTDDRLKKFDNNVEKEALRRAEKNREIAKERLKTEQNYKKEKSAKAAQKEYEKKKNLKEISNNEKKVNSKRNKDRIKQLKQIDSKKNYNPAETKLKSAGIDIIT